MAAAWIARLVKPRPTVGPAAKLSASAVASAIRSASGTARQIRPHCSAVSAVSGMPVSAKPLARASPMRRVRLQVPPESGTRPILQKAWMNFADCAASTMSQASATLAPAPAATPLTAQTTGFSIERISRTSGL